MLHTKYRPSKLEEIVGNAGLIKSLKSLLSEKEHPHTFLFTGKRGCGKTTLARIMAKEMGCHDQDIIEMDITTSRGIDAVRDLKSGLAYKPLHGKSRAFILDEVHQGTKDFFNALLKPLEEPYDHLYFFLCTTDPQKVLQTVKSRCSTYSVEALSEREMLSLLMKVVKGEDKKVPLDVLKMIHKTFEGIPRESLVMLEQIIYLESVEEMASVVKTFQTTETQIIELCRALLAKDSWDKTSAILKGIQEEPEKVRWAVLGYMNSVLLSKSNQIAAEIISNFSKAFYDSGKAGLTLACFDSIS